MRSDTQRAPRARGLTLIELMVALAVSSFVMLGITQAFIAQTREYQAHTGRREAQANGRVGISLIEEKLRLAGYGVDPNLAIAAYDSFDPVALAAAPDLSYPDAIAIHHRDPDFQRTIEFNGANAGSLQFTVPLTQTMLAGQILLAICNGAAEYAYLTVAAPAPAGSITVNLLGGAADPSPVGWPETRFRDTVGADNACLDTGEAKIVKVERYAFFVAAYDHDARDATPVMPFLLMHRGLDLNGDGDVTVDDAQPVSMGAEQLQFSYVMNTAAGAAPWVLGVTDRVPDPSAWDDPATRPRWRDSYTDDSRYLSNPANIRQVRVSLVTRASTRNEAMAGDTMMADAQAAWSSGVLADGTTVWRQLENLEPPRAEFSPTGGGFARTIGRVSVWPKNLMSRAQFLPPNFGG